MSIIADTVITKVAYAISVAGLLATGGLIFDNKITNVRQDIALEGVSDIETDLRDVTRELSLTARQLAVITDRLEQQAVRAAP